VKGKIAFFDFDGTITTKDTLLEFIKFAKGTLSFYLGFLIYSPFLVAYKLKLIPNQKAKEKVLQYFFKGMDIAQFDRYCRSFSDTKLPALIRPLALEEIHKLKAAGYTIVIVSASPENWIRYWAASQQIQLMGSRLEERDGKITGILTGKNCHGEEKVSRIRSQFNLNDYEEIHAYGDTSGDKPMLQLAHKAFYKPFH
jgi:HAD superfamily hydrolase (TIGR01490 family)